MVLEAEAFQKLFEFHLVAILIQHTLLKNKQKGKLEIHIKMYNENL